MGTHDGADAGANDANADSGDVEVLPDSTVVALTTDVAVDAPEAATDSGDETAVCEALASSCPMGCFANRGRKVRSDAGCLESQQTVGCTANDAGCEAAFTCMVRQDTGEMFWFANDCSLGDPWRHCTMAEQAVVPYDGDAKYFCP